MIRYYLSNNNEMYYNTEIQTFSPTKHTFTIVLPRAGGLLCRNSTETRGKFHQMSTDPPPLASWLVSDCSDKLGVDPPVVQINYSFRSKL